MANLRPSLNDVNEKKGKKRENMEMEKNVQKKMKIEKKRNKSKVQNLNRVKYCNHEQKKMSSLHRCIYICILHFASMLCMYISATFTNSVQIYL